MFKKPLAIIIRLLILLLSVTIIVFILKNRLQIPPYSEWFSTKPLLIENTPQIITEIKNIAELNTVQLLAEVVADSSINSSVVGGIGILPFSIPQKRTLVLIVNGRVKAGINLKLITDKNIFTNQDSISIHLPKAEIQEIITNPSDIETFIEIGKWSLTEASAVKKIARRRLIEEATSQKLLHKANERAKLVIETFLLLAGFKKITFT